MRETENWLREMDKTKKRMLGEQGGRGTDKEKKGGKEDEKKEEEEEEEGIEGSTSRTPVEETPERPSVS